MTDRMLQMGRFASAHVAQRVSYVAAEIYFVEVTHYAMRWLDSVKERPEFRALHRIISERAERLGLRHSGLFHLEVCQDDFGWIAVCPQVASIA